MSDKRPDPDQLLEQLQQESAPSRGRLKIFLGYAAGVGKTYAMLEAARAAQKNGQDVVAGYVEPHERPETRALAEGLEMVAPLTVPHGGLSIQDLDLDACLSRRPQVLLVDELAHTNAPGMRHEKRWQDVEEILDRGISVYTTLNIQHLESMNDVVARFSGILVRETMPDRIFDQAEEVEVVDLPPEDLLQRLKEGKIYAPAQAQRALNHFFKKSNLLALREMALRRAADRVGRDVDTARERARSQAIWPLRERLLVSVSPSPTSEDLLRGAARMAARLGADLLAVYIETPRNRVMGPGAKAQLQKNLDTAASLGAETVLLQGEEVAKDLVAYARLRNVTKIVLGKNRDPRWVRIFKRTIGDELVRISGDIDIYIITGRPSPVVEEKPGPRGPLPWRRILGSTVICGIFTTLAVFFQSLGMKEANVVLTLLLSVVVSAGFFGLVPSIFTSVVAVLAFNFFFTTPRYSFNVDDPQYYLVFLFMIVVGGVIGTLTDRLQSQAPAGRTRHHRMETLYRLNRDLSRIITTDEILQTAETLVSGILEWPAKVLVPRAGEGWEKTSPGIPPVFSSKDTALFSWVYQNGKKAGWGTGTLNESDYQVWPLVGSHRSLGILVLAKPEENAFLPEEKMILSEALASSVSLALERVELMTAAQRIATEMESERARSALLHGLSHDLRTPLAVISGTSSTVLETASDRLNDREKDLLSTIFRESQWLGRQVENLLSLTKLNHLALARTREWVPAEELVLSCLGRFRDLFPEVRVQVVLPETLVLCHVDPGLLDQALFNLLENAVVHGPQGQDLEIVTEFQAPDIWFRVKDRGPGVAEEDRNRIFDKFVQGARNPGPRTHRGSGLGLAIVQAVCSLHKGSCGVDPRPGGGSEFWMRIPVPENPPAPREVP